MVELSVEQYFKKLDKIDLPENHGYERMKKLEDLKIIVPVSVRRYENVKMYKEIADYIDLKFEKDITSKKLRAIFELHDIEFNKNTLQSVNIRLAKFHGKQMAREKRNEAYSIVKVESKNAIKNKLVNN